MRRRRWDLLAAMVLAILAVAIAAAGLNRLPWLAVLGGLLVMVLPGYALSSLLLSNLNTAERLLTTLGLSFVVTVLGGVVLNLTPWGLRPISWALWLGGIAVAAGLGALLRAEGATAAGRPVVPRLELKPTLGFGLAVAIVGLAVVIARSDAAGADQPFTELWAVPQHTSQAYTVRIGVSNSEGRHEVYRISVQSVGRQLQEWPRIALDPGEEWTAQVDFADLPADPVSVLLYREEAPSTLYRWVEVSPASFSSR